MSGFDLNQPESAGFEDDGAGDQPQGAIPEWIAETVERIAGVIEYQWNCHTEWCYVPPEGNLWGVHMVEIAPAPTALSDHPEPPRAFRLAVERFDLLAVHDLFDEVRLFSFSQAFGTAEITVEGVIGEEPLRIAFFPASPPRP